MMSTMRSHSMQLTPGGTNSSSRLRRRIQIIFLSLCQETRLIWKIASEWSAQNRYLVRLAKTDPRQISQKRAATFCQSKGNIPYFETSAKEALNVEQAFEVIAKNALAQEAADDYGGDFSDPINLNLSDSRSGGCACQFVSSHWSDAIILNGFPCYY